jgi:hypothetical protein
MFSSFLVEINYRIVAWQSSSGNFNNSNVGVISFLLQDFAAFFSLKAWEIGFLGDKVSITCIIWCKSANFSIFNASLGNFIFL